MSEIQKKTEMLLSEQSVEWTLLKENQAAFAQICRRSVDMGKGISFEIQFNPLRKGSSLAKIDAQSIAQRPCFLCTSNRPQEQKALPFTATETGNSYAILCNPFPIFSQHFTIVENRHVEQSFANRLSDMIELSEALSDYVLFFNGAQCGASAPDHFHFQAGNKGFMPFEQLFSKLFEQEIQLSTGRIESLDSTNAQVRSTLYPGRPYLIKASNKENLIRIFTECWNTLTQIEGKKPSANILMWTQEQYHLGIFHRKSHRPRCFYTEDESNRMISPGAVDMGGVIICTLEKDFNQLSASEIKAIFDEITVD